MPAVNTVNFQYTPWTFQELLTIPMMYTQAFKEAEAKLENLGMKAGMILPEDDSPISKGLKDKYNQSAKEAADALAGGVYNKSVYNLTKAAVNSYRENVMPIAVAQDRLKEFRQIAAHSEIPIHRNVSLDTFLTESNVDVIDGKRVQNAAAAAMKTESEFHNSTSWSIKNIGGINYISITEREGISNSDRRKTINGVEPDYIAKARENIRKVYDYDNKTREEQLAIDDNITRGLLDGMLHREKTQMQVMPTLSSTSDSTKQDDSQYKQDDSQYKQANMRDDEYAVFSAEAGSASIAESAQRAVVDSDSVLGEDYRKLAEPYNPNKHNGEEWLILNGAYEPYRHKNGLFQVKKYAISVAHGDVFMVRSGTLAGSYISPIDIKNSLSVRKQVKLTERLVSQYSTLNGMIEVPRDNDEINKIMYEYYLSPILSGNARVVFPDKGARYNEDTGGSSVRNKNNVYIGNGILPDDTNLARIDEISKLFKEKRHSITLGIKHGMPCFVYNGKAYGIIVDAQHFNTYNGNNGLYESKSLGEEANEIYQEYESLLKEGCGDRNKWLRRIEAAATGAADVHTYYIEKTKNLLNKRISYLLNKNKDIKSSKIRHNSIPAGVPLDPDILDDDWDY